MLTANDFYRRERLYRSDAGTSTLFHEVCPKELTFRKKLNPNMFKELSPGWTGTIFNEVSIVPFAEAYDQKTKNFGMENIPRTSVSRKEFAQRMFNKLLFVIENTWDSNKFHVLPHSGGYDSRLFSLILKRLRKKHGEDWLGDYLFVESHGESEPFYHIMELNGWDRSKCVVINENADPSEAHAHNFQFTDAWKRGNGYIGWPVNVWYHQVEWLQNKGLIPNDDSQIQCYTGYGANETTRSMHKTHMFHDARFDSTYKPAHGVGWYFPWHYHHDLSGFALKGNWVHHFYNFDYLREFITFSKGHIEQLPPGFSLSGVVLREINPELASVHKPVTKEIRKKGYFKISNRIFNQTIDDYKSSWYGKNIKPNVKPTNNLIYCDWWGSWYVASFCEYLLNSGHSIKV